MGRSSIRTPDQRLRVFVSSSLGELAVEREAARAAIEQLRLTPVLFELGARAHPPRDLYRAYLEQSHVFVGIYGKRYGWIAPGERISGLEDEYRLAGHQPKLLYVKRVAGARESRLENLVRQIEADGAASYREFTSVEELRELIENDLAVLLSESFDQFSAPRRARLGAPAATNLPIPRSPLVGRERELDAACDLLRCADVSLVTLTGAGGCGKSRLALEIGLELLGEFEDGVFLVTLESISDPEMVVPAIAEALHVKEIPARSSLDTLAAHLTHARTLLVLDNFEQVLSAAPAVSALLERCPRLTVLVTSRMPLRVRNERELAVPPLATPPDFHADLERLSQFAAVTLFVQRARALRADFTVTDENAPAIAEICHRLDGLPLAIELAAARLKLLSPQALLPRLASRFEVLRGGTRDLPERHRTLRTTIDWSHELLNEEERRLFRRLAVFAGGSTLEDAEMVCGLEGDLANSALDLIGSLLDKNMLMAAVGDEGDPRIGMLDSMRDYAEERLLESGEAEQLRCRHAEHYLALAEEAEPHLVGPDAQLWSRRLRSERDNYRLALEWGLEHDVELGLKLASSLWRFWEWHNGIVEAHGWLTGLLAAPTRSSPARAAALLASSRAACYLGDYASARAWIEEALPILDGLDDQRLRASAVNDLGALALCEDDYPRAALLMRESLEVKRSLGDEWLIAKALGNLGLVADYEGDHTRAYALHEESLSLFEKLDEQMGAAIELGNLAHAAMHLGRYREALQRQLQSLRMFHEIGDADGSAECVERLAALADLEGSSPEAARLLGLAAALRERAGTTRAAPERREVDEILRTTKERLDAATFDAEWHTGQTMTIEEATELATTLPTPSHPT